MPQSIKQENAEFGKYTKVAEMVTIIKHLDRQSFLIKDLVEDYKADKIGISELDEHVNVLLDNTKSMIDESDFMIEVQEEAP